MPTTADAHCARTLSSRDWHGYTDGLLAALPTHPWHDARAVGAGHLPRGGPAGDAPLIYGIGSAKLGPYANGGLGALWRDYLVALLHGSLAFWLVALGPYALLWLLRSVRYARRR